jgi:WD40-like Beta Propeller Repeat
MSRGKRILVWALVPAAAAAIWAFRPGAESLQPCAEAHRQAATYPDYSSIVIPPNVAPLNLKVLENGRNFCLRLACQAGRPVEVFSTNPSIAIPLAPWRRLLQANAAGELRMDIYVKGEGGWTHFDTVRNRIAADPIDPYVVYRYLPPVYDKWGQISLRQRDLRSFEERVVLDNQRIGGACMNCHTFLNHRTGRMLLHYRPGSGNSQSPAMILVRNGRAEKVDTRVAGKGPAAAYIAWHPSGKLLAFSRNSLFQMFHTAGVEVRDVVDRDSDLGLYAVDTGQVYTVPEISQPGRLETFPTWSPDGRYLYFCSAPALADKRNLPLQYDKIQYDLVRIAYDAATGRWGQVETVVAAARLGKSISLPQISPDGRFLMFCGHDYGSFPIFQPSSDLYLLDLSLLGTRRLDEINSPRSDSYHTWSSNSRWVLFSSKREDGLFARLYIAHLEPGGRFAKPFVLPQQDPEFYGRCLMTYNRPELLAEPVTVSPAELARAMNTATPSASPSPSGEPWQPLR